MDSLLVMKFGGTSVGSPEAIRRAAELIAREARRRPVVTVSSAMSQVTDLLLETMTCAEHGDEEALAARVQALRERHQEACSALLEEPRRSAVAPRIDELAGAFERTVRGMLMLAERPPRSVDLAVSTGEKLACLLLSELLEQQGVPSQAVDAAEVIVTDDAYGRASPLMAETTAKAHARLTPLLQVGKSPVVTGFNGATATGAPTTLGRGGSDFSAAIVASVLDAHELWIWTDVSGILSGDPRVVADARVLSRVTYNEAAELAYNGAKVLHARTLAPLIEKKIPVWIKNSFSPGEPGTCIVPAIESARGVHAITSLAGVTLLSIEAADFSQTAAQLMSRALAAAARANVEVLLLTRSSFRQNFSMLVHTRDVAAVMESLHDELALELAHGYVHPIEADSSVGLLAAVGEGMRGTPGLAGKLFTAISRENVNIIAIAQGSSELTIAIVIREADLDKAVRAVHAACGLGAADPVAAVSS